MRFEVHIPQSRSLKEKRAAVKPVVEGIRQRFSLSVAEVGYQDKWQRALIGVAVVSGSHAQAAQVVDTLERWVWSRPDIEVAGFTCHWSTWDSEE
ncbi:MAG: DUF503 domain-containing protein [Acidimicrobiales bacterium]